MGPRLSRRHLLVGAGAFAAGAASARLVGPSAALEALRSTEGVLQTELIAAERPGSLPCFAGRTLPLWTFAPDAPPILRLKAGERLRVKVENDLPRPGEHTSIHWHGIRLPNAEDGVPYLTQAPIRQGETFDYDFVPPDAGTFFFHTHCNTAEQLERGLSGILIVDGDEEQPFDAERILVLRDWAIGDDGEFGPFLTDAAARAGTFGSVRSCNGATNPEISVPASADIRVRLLNIDRTRIMQIGVEGADCAIIALDGMPAPPFPLKTWFAGPATRIDLAMRSPATGGVATLYDYFAAEPVPLAHFVAAGEPVRTASFSPAPLKPNPLPEPDLAAAERMTFTFSATATAQAQSGDVPADAISLDELCSATGTFWAINQRAWPAGDHSILPPPIATLKLGKSYVFELVNVTPQRHPIHIHGHTFKVLKSNKRHLPPHYGDTIVLEPRERMDVAFVADNPGNWMFHCHIIEHQETGMMSYIRVA